MSTSKDEYIQVVLVSENDQTLGAMGKLEAHQQGRLHRAFSIFLFNDKGETLIQQRASTKYHAPNLWANSCCGHPLPGEEIRAAAERRLQEELNIQTALTHKTRLLYKVQVSDTMTEHELVHIYCGHINQTPTNPNSEEVQALEWISPNELKSGPQDRFSPWFRIYLEKYFDTIFD